MLDYPGGTSKLIIWTKHWRELFIPPLKIQMEATALFFLFSLAGILGIASSSCRGMRCPGRPIVPYTIVQPQHGSIRENPRTLTAEVFVPQCTGRGCHSPLNSTEGCQGIECRLLPLGTRVKSRKGVCPGDGCPTGTNGGGSRVRIVKAQERAEHVLRDLPEREGSSFGIQLTCDVKPGKKELVLVLKNGFAPLTSPQGF